ncbi:MAG: hypothetical protein ABSG67_21205 [Thermoguttaceae bacterium]
MGLASAAGICQAGSIGIGAFLREDTTMDNPSTDERGKTRAAIQQARHLLLVVADLHKLGYECARVVPSIEDTAGGGDWYCIIVPASMVSPSHGAIIDSHAASGLCSPLGLG